MVLAPAVSDNGAALCAAPAAGAGTAVEAGADPAAKAAARVARRRRSRSITLALEALVVLPPVTAAWLLVLAAVADPVVVVEGTEVLSDEVGRLADAFACPPAVDDEAAARRDMISICRTIQWCLID